MTIGDAAPQERGQELRDEEDGYKITRPETNGRLRLTILFIACGKKEFWAQFGLNAETYAPPSAKEKVYTD